MDDAGAYPVARVNKAHVSKRYNELFQARLDLEDAIEVISEMMAELEYKPQRDPLDV